jgi:flavin reductase (DIM6/NTAB) family NADH-FMN oxidoreductase RutF
LALSIGSLVSTAAHVILENALAALDCNVEENLPRYDHNIIIGHVCAASVNPGAFPLVYWQGEYHPL